MEKQQLRAGFLVNPFAGIGGEAALKGSDGEQVRAEALAYAGQKLRAPQRAGRFLNALGDCLPGIRWVCGGGAMGENLLKEQGVISMQVIPVGGGGNCQTSAVDTKRVAAAFLAEGVDLVLFVGGDGTARDLLDAVGQAVPALGVPAGVKMQSGVFAIAPESAAQIVRAVMETELPTVSLRDVRDIDEAALREGRVRSCFYGQMRVPAEPTYLQHLKQGSCEDEGLVLDEIAAHLTEVMQEEGRMMLVGPGRTLAHWVEGMGLPKTLVGFDAIRNGVCLQSDLTARDVLELQAEHPNLLLVISPTGSQGALIGRGNQQLTPEFLHKLPRGQWLVVASKRKLESFHHLPMIVDSNDVALDRALCGLYPVVTAYHHQVLYPVNISYQTWLPS